MSTTPGAGADLAAELFGYAQRDGLVVSSATRAHLVSGDDGAATLLRAARGQSGVSLLVPVGQVTGTPLADLAWTADLLPVVDRACVGTPTAVQCLDRSTGTAQVRVELLEDGTGRAAWTATAPGSSSFVQPTGADLDGAGAAELAVSLLDEAGGRLVVLSGRDGAALWDARSALFPPSLVGTATGPAGRWPSSRTWRSRTSGWSP
jgi:hypothetical protein